jgi:hypothetical protein
MTSSQPRSPMADSAHVAAKTGSPSYICPKRTGKLTDHKVLAINPELFDCCLSQTGLSGAEAVSLTRSTIVTPAFAWRPKWKFDRRSTEDPVQFILRAYAAEIAAGTLHRAIIAEEDLALYRALVNWLHHNETPHVTSIPTLAEWKMRKTDRGHRASHSRKEDWDIFLSHASEDKDTFVRPLANALQERGLRVWFDEMTLTVGDSLRRHINRGLKCSRFGVVIISPSFLQKEWPQKELDGLTAREINGEKIILPVWHNINVETVRNYSPILADRIATNSARGLSVVVEDLLKAVLNREASSSLPSRPQRAKQRRLVVQDF